MSYWFAPGGRLSAAMLRIGVATSLLWMLWRIGWSGGGTAPFYYKHGVWWLYPGEPGPRILSAIAIVGFVATFAWLIGLATRAAHVVSCLACTALAAHAVSYMPTWSHTDVPPILASLALLGARTGDALSVDAWWRARRGVTVVARAGYQCSVRLAQIAVGGVFVLAAFEKLRSGGWSLHWALSDNLRHQLLVRYDWTSTPRPPIVDWLLGASWRYELCACLNIVSQLSPLVAIACVRRPRVRAVVGLLFCSEVLGLVFVMDMPTLHWLPLVAVFVDWDALAARAGLRVDPAPAPSPSRGWLAFASGFVVVFAVQGLWLNQRLHAYPFSGFPMFAVVRAKPPYDRHQTYELVGSRLEAVGAADPGLETRFRQSAAYRTMWQTRSPRALREDLATVLGETHVAAIRMWLTVFQAPAYPGPARLDPIDLAVIAELDDHGFRSTLGALLPDRQTWIAPADHPDLTGAQLYLIRDDDPAPIPIAATPLPRGFVLAEPVTADPAYLLARPPESPRAWLLAVHARRGY
jgi:hypothetical protein